MISYCEKTGFFYLNTISKRARHKEVRFAFMTVNIPLFSRLSLPIFTGTASLRARTGSTLRVLLRPSVKTLLKSAGRLV